MCSSIPVNKLKAVRIKGAELSVRQTDDEQIMAQHLPLKSEHTNG